MKKLLITLVLCFSIFNGFAQDLIYTVSGEIEGNKTSLDSILVENLTNDTRILFDNLPVLDYYQINLTQNAFWGTVGINYLEKAPVFDVLENRPGSLTIAYLENVSTDVKLAVYNINGQKVFNSEKNMLNGGNSIKVQLGTPGMFLVKIESSLGTSTFKAIGDNSFKQNFIEISDKTSKAIIKSSIYNEEADISFVPGDSIRLSVYKDGYFADALKLVIDTSKFVNFLFELNSTGVVSSVTDTRDGKTYSTITINGKEWMTETLAYLPSVSKVTSESKTEPHYYVYGYNDTIVSEAVASDNYKTYGALYNFPAAKNACPDGWHLPTLDEWVKVARFVTDQNGLTHTTGDFWDGVGKYLKATEGWGVGNGNDQYGFSCLPGGYRHMNGNFYALGSSGFWWTATELTSTNVIMIWMQSSSDLLIQSHNDTNFGYCIRCLKD